MSSGTFPDELQSAWADECENMTGAWLVAKASFIVLTDEWDKSIIMPNRFISRTTNCNEEKTKNRWTTNSESNKTVVRVTARKAQKRFDYKPKATSAGLYSHFWQALRCDRRCRGRKVSRVGWDNSIKSFTWNLLRKVSIRMINHIKVTFLVK